MKKLSILMIGLVITVLTSQAQEGVIPEATEKRLAAIKPTLLEKHFMVSIIPKMVGLLKAQGQENPTGSEEKFGLMLVARMRENEVFDMDQADELLFENKGEIEGLAEDVNYWKGVRKNITNPKRKNDILMLAMGEYFSGLTEKSSVEDKLMLSKLTKSMKKQAVAMSKTLEISKSKQVYLKALQAMHVNGKWVDYADLKIDDKMKFKDPESGELMDWVMHKDAEGKPKRAFIVSPKPWKEFYIITMNDGATLAVPLKEAKEKYGIGK